MGEINRQKKEIKFILYGITECIKTIDEELNMVKSFVQDVFNELKRLEK